MNHPNSAHVWRQRRLPGFDYADPNHAFFVTIRAYGSSAPFTDDRLARAVITSLDWLRSQHAIALYAFCLMPDHLHLLLRLEAGDRTLGAVMGSLKNFTTRQSWRLEYRGPLWQSRFHDHILRRSEDAHRIAAYILANPVRKRLVEEESEYPYSGTPDPME